MSIATGSKDACDAKIRHYGHVVVSKAIALRLTLSITLKKTAFPALPESAPCVYSAILRCSAEVLSSQLNLIVLTGYIAGSRHSRCISRHR
ncbi:MAG: hypothetical protein MZU97_27285 [Bacillus subtilis]|nr:hypothetical protein [Bacillus subtilis]